MEIKEKFAGQSGREKFFGIDAGRIMMLLRLCLPNDSNALYLIKELDEAGSFIGWKFITLRDIIMTASWNPQAAAREWVVRAPKPSVCRTTISGSLPRTEFQRMSSERWKNFPKILSR